MVETADNLCSRFNDSIGAIRSWDFGTWNFRGDYRQHDEPRPFVHSQQTDGRQQV